MAESPGWLVELSTGEPSVYVFPHGGAGSSAVAPLAKVLAGQVRVVAVRLPGRESSSHLSCETDVEVIAANAASQIREELSPQARVALYGHCAGAIIAYEVAALLSDTFRGALVVSSHEPPDRIPRPGVWTWPDDEFLERVASDGFLPPQVLEDDELRELCLAPLRADYQAIETHHTLGDVLSWPILALYPTVQARIAEQDMRAWNCFTNNGFRLKHMDAPHHLLTAAVPQVAEQLKSVTEDLA